MKISQPKQARSGTTLGRLVKSAEHLLEGRPLSELTISEIVRGADSSIGSFYGRFPDKQALLEYIDETYAHRIVDGWIEFLRPDRWAGKTLESMVLGIVTRIVFGQREKSGVARALYLYVRTDAPPSTIIRARAINQSVERLMVDLLLTRRRELRPRNPEAAIRTALLFTVAAIREAVLFGNLKLHEHLSPDQRLIRELTGAFCACVQAPSRRTSVR
ncbi:MAG TPA: TetR/AcrR family transcriptional regulator [Blastocatellia bacterium]